MAQKITHAEHWEFWQIIEDTQWIYSFPWWYVEKEYIYNFAIKLRKSLWAFSIVSRSLVEILMFVFIYLEAVVALLVGALFLEFFGEFSLYFSFFFLVRRWHISALSIVSSCRIVLFSWNCFLVRTWNA